MTPEELTAIAAKCAAAWSSQDPALLAAHYAEDGSLQVNFAEPAVEREAITATPRAFIAAFPEMIVELEQVTQWPDCEVGGALR